MAAVAEQNAIRAYEMAKELYAGLGVDTEKALDILAGTEISLHCWQGDDCNGFERATDTLTGGIVATGGYPGRARTPEELRSDLDKAMSLLPGRQKVNLHAFYLDAKGVKVDRDGIEPEHFSSWADWACERKLGLDFNPTFFSHPKSGDGFTLSHGDKSIRDFWIEHGKRARRVGEYFGKRTGKPCITNIWIPDGYKDNPIDRLAPRQRLLEALDEIFKERISPAYNKDAVESKLFGIGSEAYVTGSHEFYLAYAVQRRNVLVALDAGHFHPTEVISAKISAMLLFLDELLLHVSRPVRWDSDHVVTLDDELCNIMHEVVRCGALSRVKLALDYFDGSINRLAAWIIGTRNAQKALLRALLEPVEALRAMEAGGDFTARLALTEEYKCYPFAAVWDYYCLRENVPMRDGWLSEVRAYEREVLSAR